MNRRKSFEDPAKFDEKWKNKQRKRQTGSNGNKRKKVRERLKDFQRNYKGQ